MSFFKSIQSKYRSWNRKRRGLIEDDYVDHASGQSGSLWRSFMGVVVLPLKMLFVPLRLIGLIQTQDATTSNETEELGFSQRVLFVLKQVLSLPFLLLREPIRIFKSLRRARTRDLLFALPAIAILGFFGFVFVQIFAYVAKLLCEFFVCIAKKYILAYNTGFNVLETFMYTIHVGLWDRTQFSLFICKHQLKNKTMFLGYFLSRLFSWHFSSKMESGKVLASADVTEGLFSGII